MLPSMIYCFKENCSIKSIVNILFFSGEKVAFFKVLFSPYSVRMQENVDQNKSEYGHFLHSDNPWKQHHLGTHK